MSRKKTEFVTVGIYPDVKRAIEEFADKHGLYNYDVPAIWRLAYSGLTEKQKMKTIKLYIEPFGKSEE